MRLLLPILVLTLTSTFWGVSWIPLNFFESNGVHGTVIIFITHAILACVFFPFGFKFNYLTHHRLSVIGIAIAGGMGIFSFTYAYIYGDVVRVMVLFYLLPIWGVLGGRLFLKERLDFWRWLGVFLAILGAFLILGGIAIFNAPPSWIDFLALLSGFSFAMNNILFRGVKQMELASKLLVMFVGVSIITGVGLVVSTVTSGTSPTAGIEISTWLWLVAYALSALLLANYGSQWAIERMEASKSSIIITFQLVAAVLSATLIGGNSLDSSEWLGCFLVVSASLLEAFRDKSAPSQVAS